MKKNTFQKFDVDGKPKSISIEDFQGAEIGVIINIREGLPQSAPTNTLVWNYNLSTREDRREIEIQFLRRGLVFFWNYTAKVFRVDSISTFPQL